MILDERTDAGDFPKKLYYYLRRSYCMVQYNNSGDTSARLKPSFYIGAKETKMICDKGVHACTHIPINYVF